MEGLLCIHTRMRTGMCMCMYSCMRIHMCFYIYCVLQTSVGSHYNIRRETLKGRAVGPTLVSRKCKILRFGVRQEWSGRYPTPFPIPARWRSA